jgi:hypothetical protein
VGGGGRHVHLFGDLPIGVAHQAIFHRLLDVLLALDLGLGRSVALLPCTELAVKSMEHLPKEVAETKATVFLLPSLVAKMSNNEERWNWFKGRAYYSIAGILMWATLTGKMSLHELMALLGRLESLAVLLGR